VSTNDVQARRRVLVAMSGGVDSSVTAGLLRDAGYEVVGVTMKLWGGASDTGCCSVSDVDDARRVAQQLDIDHLVFNFTDVFDDKVVDPYVAAHADGRTPNPCVECNRHLKFAHLLARADRMGFDAIATGHHARVKKDASGVYELRRGVDHAKDQSYVLHMLDQSQLPRILLPVGELTKAQVRAHAARLGLRTANKPDSQDVCFITSKEGRRRFLEARLTMHEAEVLETGFSASGAREQDRSIGRVDAVELVTIGQRRGLGVSAGERRFVVDVDVPGARVIVGPRAALDVRVQPFDAPVWTTKPVAVGTQVRVQCSAHGFAHLAVLREHALEWNEPQRRVAPGQSLAFYDAADDVVLGGAIAGRAGAPRAAMASADR